MNQCYQRCLASKLAVLVDGDLIRTLQPLKLRRLCVGLTTASSLIKTHPALAGIGCTLHCSRTACSAMKQMTCPGYAACCLCSSSQQMIRSIGATIHLCFHEEHHVKQLTLCQPGVCVRRCCWKTTSCSLPAWSPKTRAGWRTCCSE